MTTGTAFEWRRGDVIRDDTGNLYCYHPRHGWLGLGSNRSSARGGHDPDELVAPLILLIRDGEPTRVVIDPDGVRQAG